MLTGALTGEGTLVLALDTAEKAVPVHLAQVEEKCVEARVQRLNFCLEAFEGKLDFTLLVENLLYESLTQV